MENQSSSDFHTCLLVSFALAFGWSWVCCLLFSVITPQLPSLAGVLFLAVGFGLSLVKIAVVRQVCGRNGLRGWLDLVPTTEKLYGK
jgi:uncharacterized protein